MGIRQTLSLVLALLFFLSESVFADTPQDPCGGSSAILALINRPTIADSACVVPYKKTMLEFGIEAQKLKGGGHGYNLPEAQLRVGLPGNNEFTVLLPNYFHQALNPRAGFTATAVGLKHEIGYTSTFLGSVEGLFTLPSGSSSFGSDGLGATFNGIVQYTLSSASSLAFMLGVTSETLPYSSGGQRFTSINPDLVLTYQLTDKWETYGEVYGQSRTGVGRGAGFNADAGFLYLITPQISADIELGQRISGKLGQFNNYLGFGMGLLF